MEEVINIDNLAVNGVVIIGAINFLNIAFPKITSLQKVLAVLVVGGILPYLPDLVPFWSGIELALGASGIYKVGQKVGGK